MKYLVRNLYDYSIFFIIFSKYKFAVCHNELQDFYYKFSSLNLFIVVHILNFVGKNRTTNFEESS